VTFLNVAVSSSGPTLDSQVDYRFGRCNYYIIVDTNTMKYETVLNENANAMGGAGIQAAQMLISKGVQTVITGSVGPNAFQVFSSAGIRIFVGASGSVREVIDKFKRGELAEASTAGPTGMGVGRGMGRGMGAGRGSSKPQFIQASYPQSPIPPPTSIQYSKEKEISMLEEQIKNLQQQLEQVKKRLDELKETKTPSQP